MAYPTKLLAENEQVQFELRPHWRSLLWPVLWLVVIVGVWVFLSAKFGEWLSGESGVLSIVRWAIAAVSLFLLFFLTVRPFITWATTHYVFTNRRIIVRQGLIGKKGRDMPLSKVNAANYDSRTFESLFNAGTLRIESAAERGTLVIANVPNVEHVQREVYQLIEEDDAYRSARSQMYEQQFREGDLPEPLVGQTDDLKNLRDAPSIAEAEDQVTDRPTRPPEGSAGGSGG